ncbi:cobalt-precorrin-7 (C(5))-methyltransferase [Acerihabitans sp. TG2]|uniref:cobalt-precorrin-7 (C(5))-methyltransferase n=1 Tax=Acerihabitans sp. TG2 TaxID=3096008 RepID=UPI002B23B054|nr:cobalt-precorrin-7 (C(5))-methyltransferase [Acerihabitans sp. TG2]MEA9389340.1 cobalt-precorrin-7 (C(5))-methyltransferase [Acerihabitans sp. TG2]
MTHAADTANISVVGLGPGDSDYLVPQAKWLIDHCEVLIGSSRQLNCFPGFCGEKRQREGSLAQLVVWLNDHCEQPIVVLASGDPMLYGIGDYLSRQLDPARLRIVPGISAAQYLFSRLALSMNDVFLTSSHGRTPDFDFVLQHAKVAMVTDQQIGPYDIAQQILARGLRRKMIVGENLSYPDERILRLAPEQVARHYAMNVVVILDER